MAASICNTGSGIANILFGAYITSSKTGSPIGEENTRAFDNIITGSKWLEFNSANQPNVTQPTWLQFRFPTGQKGLVTSYSIISANDEQGRDPRDWQVLGSNDGSTWATIDSRTAQTFTSRHQTKTYTLASAASYSHYRLNITTKYSSLSNSTQLSEFQLFGSVISATSAGGDPHIYVGPERIHVQIPDHIRDLTLFKSPKITINAKIDYLPPAMVMRNTYLSMEEKALQICATYFISISIHLYDTSETHVIDMLDLSKSRIPVRFIEDDPSRLGIWNTSPGLECRSLTIRPLEGLCLQMKTDPRHVDYNEVVLVDGGDLEGSSGCLVDGSLFFSPYYSCITTPPFAPACRSDSTGPKSTG